MMTKAFIKSLLYSFKQFLIQVSGDAMLFIACIAPILCGLLFRNGIPFVEKIIMRRFLFTEFLTPYYLMFDVILAVLTPLMLCFVSAMVMLGEIDDKISNYLSVTPLGKKGYFVSRLVLPMVISFGMTIVLLRVFSLTLPSLSKIILLSMLTSLFGLIVSMLVVSISTNKVEGMAMTKLAGLFLLGIPVPFFVTGSVQYLLFFLPSLWLSKYAQTNKFLWFVFGILTSLGWIILLLRKFNHKMQ